MQICKNYDYTLTDAATIKVKNILSEMYSNRDEHFANARTIRNYFEQVITRQALRLSSASVSNDTALTTIDVDDLT